MEIKDRKCRTCVELQRTQTLIKIQVIERNFPTSQIHLTVLFWVLDRRSPFLNVHGVDAKILTNLRLEQNYSAAKDMIEQPTNAVLLLPPIDLGKEVKILAGYQKDLFLP